ncbi:hypothetical protein CRYPD_167 [uncultured Candidatus Thioglobus sp.]|nr:hypothetical protein CRYPD_167 [uncultured Candidatus Thioglobus sp.]
MNFAYYDARKHRRNTQNQLEFALKGISLLCSGQFDYDIKLIALAE